MLYNFLLYNLITNTMPDLPIQQSQKEFEHMARLQQERARDRQIATAQETNIQEDEQQNPNQSAASKNDISFPVGMFFLAASFDVLGFIPIVNIVCVVTEPIAGFIFYYWQKNYAPNTNPVKSLIINKAIDLLTIGISPSNSIVVLRAYSKKKAANMV